MPFLKDLRMKPSIEFIFLETRVSPSMFMIKPSVSFRESTNAMPFYEPTTKTAVERASASMKFFVITVADIEPDVAGYPVLESRI
jgi:hypothetical protein